MFSKSDFQFLESLGLDVSEKSRSQNLKKSVIIGMSGGVDSSVAALVLKAQGYRVSGIFMKNWDETDEFGVCSAEADYADVIKVSDCIDMPYYTLNFVKEYERLVFKQFIEDYKSGHTPNPDIFCNKEIKFNHFYDACIQMGADYIATGHYCRIGKEENEFVLKKGRDPGKDQSYFLAGINKNVLKNVLFPLGDLLKKDVRKIAEYFNLPTKSKKDSTGVCFIGERNFREFLQNYINIKSGEFQTLDGKNVGTHHGSAFYTLGQRKGLGLGGAGDPWYVVDKDHEKNIVFVERDKYHKRLISNSLVASEVNVLTSKLPLNTEITAKIRYRQKDQACKIKSFKDGKVLVEFDVDQRAVVKKQYLAFYKNETCLGGAVIESAKTLS